MRKASLLHWHSSSNVHAGCADIRQNDSIVFRGQQRGILSTNQTKIEFFCLVNWSTIENVSLMDGLCRRSRSTNRQLKLSEDLLLMSYSLKIYYVWMFLAKTSLKINNAVNSAIIRISSIIIWVTFWRSSWLILYEEIAGEFSSLTVNLRIICRMSIFESLHRKISDFQKFIISSPWWMCAVHIGIPFAQPHRKKRVTNNCCWRIFRKNAYSNYWPLTFSAATFFLSFSWT